MADRVIDERDGYYRPHAEPPEPVDCQACGGDGWYVGHENECYETGDCNCSGVQIGCEVCGGSGQVSRG